MKKKYILGIHIGHDATAALIDNEGRIIAAVAEERLTRIKNHTGFPYCAIDEVLKIGNINKEDVKAIASEGKRIFYPGFDEYNDFFFIRDIEVIKKIDQYNTPQVEDKYLRLWKLFKQNLGLVKNHKSGEHLLNESEKLTYSLVRTELDKLGFEHAKLETIEHHHCHATSSFFTSGSKEALIITMDGSGEGLCATVSVSKDGKINRVSSASSDCSPGRFYSEITWYLGFKRNRHEGKITGLAAFGDPKRYYKKLSKFLRFNPDREKFEFEYANDNRFVRKFKTVRRILNNENFNHPYIDSFHQYLKRIFNPQEDAKDLAAAAQDILEDIVIAYIKHFLEKYPNKNVLLAGGVFANVRVNQKISEIEGVNFIYIHQNMGDGGCALGAALSYLHEIENIQYMQYQPVTAYYGCSFKNSEIEKALTECNIEYVYDNEIEKSIAQLIYKGKVVGRFNGQMEYGPRALGNRSIIASSTDKSINDWLNKKLGRTEFMPFAPAVLYEYANELFENYDKKHAEYASYFMTITFNVKKEWQKKIQAATHIDGTARPQVIKKEQNPSFYQIIEEYCKLSNIPAVINTSFNMHEEPIVATPFDAIRAFKQGAIDYMAIGNYLCRAL